MWNIENLEKSSWKKSHKSLLYAAIAAALLNVSNSREVKADTITNDTRQNIEQVISSDIVDKIQQRTWATLPDWYEGKVRNLINQSILFEDEAISKYTEDFIVKRINKNPWIDEKNRTLDIYNLCIEYILDVDVYSWEDWNEKRTQEFIKVAPILNNALDEYTTGVTPIVSSFLFSKLDRLIYLYESFKINSKDVSQSEIDRARESLRILIPICKQFGIDPSKKLYNSREFYGL